VLLDRNCLVDDGSICGDRNWETQLVSAFGYMRVEWQTPGKRLKLSKCFFVLHCFREQAQKYGGAKRGLLGRFGLEELCSCQVLTDGFYSLAR
jgi:hypothetical protein